MPDREKIVEIFNELRNFADNDVHPVVSPENWDVYSKLRDLIDQAEEDALALLKEREAEWIYGEDETGVDGWRCSECNFFEPWFYEFDDDIDFIKRYKHCPKCGRRMISYTGKQEGR